MSLRRACDLAMAFMALAACQIAGSLISHYLHLPIPGTVIGLLMLLVALSLLRRVPSALREVADHLLKHLNLFYIPAAIGIMAHVVLVRQDILPILAALFGSTFLSLIIGVLVFQWVRGNAAPEGDGL